MPKASPTSIARHLVRMQTSVSPSIKMIGRLFYKVNSEFISRTQIVMLRNRLAHGKQIRKFVPSGLPVHDESRPQLRSLRIGIIAAAFVA